MNHCVPNSKMVDEQRLLDDLFHATNEKYSNGSDNELIELLWRNGHVVFHSQANRSLSTIFESAQAQKPESSPKCGDSIGYSRNFIQENETASWFPYPLDDSLEKEFSEFFCGMVNAELIGTEKTCKIKEKFLDHSSKEESSACDKQSNVMPPPKPLMVASTQRHSSLENGAVMSFSNRTKPERANMGSENRKEASGSGIVVAMGESSSMRTIVSSVCGSNQVQNQVEVSNVRGANDSLLRSSHKRLQENTFESAIASSSDGSGSSFGRTGQQSTTNHVQKRKRTDVEESEGHNEEAEYESVEANKPSQRPTSGRRSRAAEVHNLSERRRRDRINEKMRALQELIPHCNKSDKASMLDEAIEYLKSLQLQVQIMWMGGGMAPMVFPGVQQYMPQMGIGMSHPSMPSIPNPIQLHRAPFSNQSMAATSIPNQLPVCSPQGTTSFNFPTHMQNCHLPEAYSSYYGFPQMQMPSQMNMYGFGSQIMQQNAVPAAADSNHVPAARAPSDHIQTGHSG